MHGAAWAWNKEHSTKKCCTRAEKTETAEVKLWQSFVPRIVKRRIHDICVYLCVCPWSTCHFVAAWIYSNAQWFGSWLHRLLRAGFATQLYVSNACVFDRYLEQVLCVWRSTCYFVTASIHSSAEWFGSGLHSSLRAGFATRLYASDVCVRRDIMIKRSERQLKRNGICETHLRATNRKKNMWKIGHVLWYKLQCRCEKVSVMPPPGPRTNEDLSWRKRPGGSARH